jgi:hypothetical protein
MKVASLERIPEITILHHLDTEGQLWATRGRTIVKGESGAKWTQVADFPRAYPRDLFGFSRPTARALRADKANVYVNTHGGMLGIRAGIVYALDLKGNLTSLFEIQGDSVDSRR